MNTDTANLILVQQDATYAVYYISVGSSYGRYTYRTIHMNQFQLIKESEW